MARKLGRLQKIIGHDQKSQRDTEWQMLGLTLEDQKRNEKISAITKILNVSQLLNSSLNIHRYVKKRFKGRPPIRCSNDKLAVIVCMSKM